MSPLNILLAIGVAVMVAVLVGRNVEADWVGPLAGGLVAGALVAFELKRKGRRDAR